MKKIISCLALAVILGFSGPLARAQGQTEAAAGESDLQVILDMLRSDVNAYKIRTINQVMALTEAEAGKFWPVYQEYEKALEALDEQRLGTLREYLELQAGGANDGKRWDALAKQYLKNRRSQLDLWNKYQKKIAKAVSPYRAAQFLQIEHQMNLFIDLNVASEMPTISSAPPVERAALATPAPTREETVLVTVTATVEAIDYDRREVTLKGQLGNTVTFEVDERVKRLKEVKVGDTVTADYYISVAAELREPTAEEKQNPLVIVEGGGRTPPGTQPAGGGLRRIKAVCTIEGLDRPTETVTVKGPLGRHLTVRVADPANLPHLRIGDTVVVTYTEALAVSLEKLEGGTG